MHTVQQLPNKGYNIIMHIGKAVLRRTTLCCRAILYMVSDAGLNFVGVPIPIFKHERSHGKKTFRNTYNRKIGFSVFVCCVEYCPIISACPV